MTYRGRLTTNRWDVRGGERHCNGMKQGVVHRRSIDKNKREDEGVILVLGYFPFLKFYKTSDDIRTVDLVTDRVLTVD